MIIIDSLALAHRAKYAMKSANLSTEDMETGVIFNFVNALLQIASRFDDPDFIFAWDSRKYFRKDFYPGYKKKSISDKTLEEVKFDDIAYPQFNELRNKVIPDMGFKNNFIQTGMEADDIIAALSKGYPETSFMIISRDGDLYQLLTEDMRVMMYDPISKKVINWQTVFDQHGIKPDRWWEVKAHAGCDNDKVEGVGGVGIKTAIKYLNGILKPSTKAHKEIQDKQSVIERNEKLVKLPYEGTTLPTLQKDELYWLNFNRVFEKYEFKTFLYPDQLQRWIQAFQLL